MVDGTNTVFIDSDAVREATLALDTIGFTCHYHSYGELSTTWVLDAVADARAVNGSGGGRHHIAHLMVIAERDFARFAELDVSANVQAAWGYSTVAHDILGLTTCSDDPHLREYAFGRLAAAGARLVAGSDWPVTTADPLEAMRLEASRGRVRKATGAEGDPDELDRLDLPTLLTAYTAGSAFVNGRAHTTGRIATGFLADLVVLDRDPFSSDESLREVSVDETWIDGQRVFRRGEDIARSDINRHGRAVDGTDLASLRQGSAVMREKRWGRHGRDGADQCKGAHLDRGTAAGERCRR